MDIYDDDFDYTDYTDEDDYDNDDFDFHHGNVDDLYDDVGDDYGYDAWGIQSDGEDETPFTIPIPADLAEFYPERKSCVKSFLELYVLCGKILKMIRLIDDYYLYYNLEDGKFVKDVKTVQVKCRLEISSALGKVVPLPSVVVDKLLDHILGSHLARGSPNVEKNTHPVFQHISHLWYILMMTHCVRTSNSGGILTFSLSFSKYC